MLPGQTIPQGVEEETLHQIISLLFDEYLKYPVNEPCKQKQDPVCYACLTEVYLTKRSKSSQY